MIVLHVFKIWIGFETKFESKLLGLLSCVFALFSLEWLILCDQAGLAGIHMWNSPCALVVPKCNTWNVQADISFHLAFHLKKRE